MARTARAARPPVACEIFADRVVAARSAPAGEYVEVHTARQLAAGTVTPSLTGTNVNDPAALAAVLEDALNAIAGRGRDVIAIIPDAAVRVVLLDFDSLPESFHEAAGVIRFRLKKSLPFDVEKSVVSFYANRAASPVKVVATVGLASVVAEYEAAFRTAGYNPGIVVPSTVAALGAVGGDRPTLILKVDGNSTTLAIVEQNQLRLFRSLETAAVNGNAQKLADEVYPSLVFFEDQFHSSVERILVGGMVSAGEMAPALALHTASPVEELVPERYVSGGLNAGTKSGVLAGVVGALVS
jgi:type IV pilus assembly protein PilM